MVVAFALLAALLVRMDTALGPIVLALEPQRAPISTAAFMRCVDSGHYNGSTFYRVVRLGNQSPHRPIQVVQGGLDRDSGPLPPVRLETTAQTGLRNLAATIGVPRDRAPNTGSACDFYINTIVNPILDSDRSPDKYGYAVFGRVVSGMAIVKRIEFSPAKGQRLDPPIRIARIARVAVVRVHLR